MNTPDPAFPVGKIKLQNNSAIPKYRQLAEILRQKILSGELPDGCRLPSEAEWANGLNINHLTLRKSLKILAEQRLITQRQGKGSFVCLVPQPLQRIGVLMNHDESLLDVYDLKILTTLSYRLQKIGAIPIPINCLNVPPQQLIDIINSNNCDNLLVLNCPKEYICQLYSPDFNHLKMVFINNFEEINSSAERFNVGNQENFISQALDYLTSLGHRRILYISIDNPNSPVLRLRNQEFYDYPLAEKINGIQPLQSGWYNVGLKVARKYCSAPNPPTAILTSGINLAFGAWNGILESGLKIPQDISVISPDGLPKFNSEMTTIDPAITEIITKATDLLLDMQRAGKHLKQKEYYFAPNLVERGSCRKIERIVQ